MTNEEVKIGEHCWALSNDRLLIVLKSAPTFYEVCGAWECGIGADELEIIQVIPRPAAYENTKLYYH